MNSYFISVIIPLYNFEDYITRCLDSLAKQKCKNFEVIIVNDGSTDNSREVVEKYICDNNLSNFKIISQENGGVSKARNKGITNSNGTWIAFVDADDYVTDDFIYELKEKCNNCEFVIGNFNYFYDDKFVKNEYFFDINDIPNKENLFVNLLNEKKASLLGEKRINSLRNVWGKLYNKKILLDNNIYFDEKIKFFEDGLFNLRYIDKISKISFSPNYVYNYYVDSKGSATKKMRKGIVEEDKIKLNKTLNIIKKYESEKIEQAFNLFKYDCFMSYLINSLFHTKNKESFSKKKKELKSVLKMNIYNCFDTNIRKYLNKDKKILFTLLKNEKYLFVCILLELKKLFKR